MVLVAKFHRWMTRLSFALEWFTGSEALFDSLTEIYFQCYKRAQKESLNLISQLFFTLNPSPSNEIEKKSQRRLLFCSFWN